MSVRSRVALVVFVASLASVPTDARAGIQNVQSALATEADEGISGSTTASVDWRTGNVSFLFIAVDAALRYRSGPHLIVGLARGERKSSGDSVIVSRTFEHLRYRYDINDRLLWEAFAQHEFDGVKRLNIRTVAGTGPRVSLLERDGARVGLGVAYMLEYERIKDDGEVDGGDSELVHRLSSYAVGSYALAERLQLVETFYVQPKLNEPSDVRVLSESSVVVQATSRVSLSTSFNVAHDSRPPQTIKKTDTALISKISVEF